MCRAGVPPKKTKVKHAGSGRRRGRTRGAGLRSGQVISSRAVGERRVAAAGLAADRPAGFALSFCGSERACNGCNWTRSETAAAPRSSSTLWRADDSAGWCPKLSVLFTADGRLVRAGNGRSETPCAAAGMPFALSCAVVAPCDGSWMLAGPIHMRVEWTWAGARWAARRARAQRDRKH